MKKHVLSLLGLCCLCGLQAQQTYQNPVIHGDVADPTIIRVNQTYYAAGTSSEWAPFYPLYQSSDLVNWVQIGHLFDQQPEWTKSSFWAPELFQYKGKTYVYYTARRKSDGISYIGVATADSPAGPYTDHGVVVEYGTEAIDAFILEDGGDLYISWKAYGLDKRPIELLGCKLSDDGLRLDGEIFSLLKDDERRGMEGQHWLKAGDYYYLIYSVNGCCGPQSDYAVAIARSKHLKGPYEKYEGNPILHGDGKTVQSCGHGTITTTPDGRMFYLCHAYLTGDDFFMGRQPILQEIVLGEDDWFHFKEGEEAKLQHPTPFPQIAQQPVFDFQDDFASRKLNVAWSWNYPYSTPDIRLEKGRLSLQGTLKPDCTGGTALCLRPEASLYCMETAVANQNQAWKGLTLYGDDKNYVTFGVQGDNLQLKMVKSGEDIVLSEPIPLPENQAVVYLRMQVKGGHPESFSYSLDNRSWLSIQEEKNGLQKSLVQWDRVARPGLFQQGAGAAEFEYVRMSYPIR